MEDELQALNVTIRRLKDELKRIDGARDRVKSALATVTELAGSLQVTSGEVRGKPVRQHRQADTSWPPDVKSFSIEELIFKGRRRTSASYKILQYAQERAKAGDDEDGFSAADVAEAKKITGKKKSNLSTYLHRLAHEGNKPPLKNVGQGRYRLKTIEEFMEEGGLP